MPLINIHPDFKLQDTSFDDIGLFLSFIKKQYPLEYVFLKDLFDETDSVQVATSGSTGKPKKIQLSKQAMLHSAEATGQFFELPSKTTALHCLSSDYIAGKMMWIRALHLGWYLEVVKPDSNPLAQTKANFDFAAMVPLQVQTSLTDLHRIQKLIIGGAAISYSLEEELKHIATVCYQTYGMTETITHIAVRKLTTAKTKQYYQSLPTITLGVDQRDCLTIKAPLLTDKLVITNDIVNLISQNEFEWLGRYDHVINSGGVKLFPEQIEAKISTSINLPFIVGALSDEKLGEKLVLVVESQNPIPDIQKQLSKANLSKYEYPKEIYYLPSFVFTENSKIRRNETLDLL